MSDQQTAVLQAARQYIDNPDVSSLHDLKRCIANLDDPQPTGESAWFLARKIVDDCKNMDGSFYEEGLVHAISGIIVALYRAQGRLPLYLNV